MIYANLKKWIGEAFQIFLYTQSIASEGWGRVGLDSEEGTWKRVSWAGSPQVFVSSPVKWGCLYLPQRTILRVQGEMVWKHQPFLSLRPDGFHHPHHQGWASTRSPHLSVGATPSPSSSQEQVSSTKEGWLSQTDGRSHPLSNHSWGDLNNDGST